MVKEEGKESLGPLQFTVAQAATQHHLRCRCRLLRPPRFLGGGLADPEPVLSVSERAADSLRALFPSGTSDSSFVSVSALSFCVPKGDRNGIPVQSKIMWASARLFTSLPTGPDCGLENVKGGSRECD